MPISKIQTGIESNSSFIKPLGVRTDQKPFSRFTTALTILCRNTGPTNRNNPFNMTSVCAGFTKTM